MAEKTEEPTPKKLQEARKKGNVAQSRDLSSALVFVTGLALIALVARATAAAFSSLWFDVVTAVTRGDALLGQVPVLLDAALIAILAAVAPLLAAAAVVGVAASCGQFGLLLSARSLKPDLRKLNPLTKLKQWFGVKGLIELLKSLVKILAVAWLGIHALRTEMPDILRLSLTGPQTVTSFLPDLLRPFLWSVAGVTLALAGGDFIFQRWQWKKGLRMSKDEIKQEFKNSEGDPEIKGERKALHREMANDVGQAVKGSSAVVVNPTHVAVALEYQRGGESAPRVVAKGRGAMAAKIRSLARRHRVPVVRDVPLARALHGVELGSQVPAELYEAVAEVLLFVWRLREGEER